MKSFSFLSPKREFNGISFRPEIIEYTYDFCQSYKEHVERCRQLFLEENPETDEETDFSFPIHNFDIRMDFDEGTLWHGGSDYNPETDRISHFVYLDSPGYGELDDYFIEVFEFDDGRFAIEKVERDRSRWE